MMDAVAIPPFEAFYEEHRAEVLRLLRRRLGAQRAEDAFQETFLRALRAYRRLDDAEHLRAWVLTIARNVAIDMTRIHRPIATEPETLRAIDERDWSAGPLERSLVAEDAQRLHNALLRLSEEQRRAVVLAGLYGFTAREIAEVDSIPLGTAKTRIRTALIRLRTMLVHEDSE